MKRKYLPLLVLIALALAGATYLLLQKNNDAMSDANISKKFDCERQTADLRETDYYCQNPDAYRDGKPVPADYLKGM